MIGLEPIDRVSVPCSKCKSRGWFECYEPRAVPIRVIASALSVSEVITKHRTSCEACDGEGWIRPSDGDVVDVYQDGRAVCRCEIPARFRRHFLVDNRPGDFTPKLQNGQMVYEAARMIGPGDLELLYGYRPITTEEADNA